MAPPDYSDLLSIKGKVALVTGASSGIGSRFAVFLASQGALVVVAARRTEKLKDLVTVRRVLAFAVSLLLTLMPQEVAACAMHASKLC